MRHGDKINNLGRTVAHRRAMLANMANSLIQHKRITTTLAKAKALRRFVEPLVTKAKDNTTHSRRVVFSYLQSKEAIQELFGTVAEKVGDRPGGYVRIIKMGFRRGDGADMAMIELVDFNEVYNPKTGKSADKKKTRRGRRTSKAATAAAAAPKVAAPAPVVEAPVVEEEVAEAAAEVEETVVAAAETAAPVAEEVAATEETTASEAPAAEEGAEEKTEEA